MHFTSAAYNEYSYGSGNGYHLTNVGDFDESNIIGALGKAGIMLDSSRINLQGVFFDNLALNAPYNYYKGIAALCYSV